MQSLVLPTAYRNDKNERKLCVFCLVIQRTKIIPEAHGHNTHLNIQLQIKRKLKHLCCHDNQSVIWTKSAGLEEGLLQNFFCKNICSIYKAINGNFQFFLYVNGTLHCHSNQISHLIGTKNIIYVESYVNIMYANYQLHPLMSF